MMRGMMVVLGLALLPGCPAGTKVVSKTDETSPNDVTKAEGVKSMQGKITDLDTLRGLVGSEIKAFMERYHIKPQHLRTSAVFERLSNLTEIHEPTLSPARFFFKDDKLVLIYLEDSATLGAYDRTALKARLGGNGVLLRSRAGKSNNLHVYSQQGMAVSIGQEVDFIQIFTPMAQSEYEQNIYQDPGKFAL